MFVSVAFVRHFFTNYCCQLEKKQHFLYKTHLVRSRRDRCRQNGGPLVLMQDGRGGRDLRAVRGHRVGVLGPAGAHQHRVPSAAARC